MSPGAPGWTAVDRRPVGRKCWLGFPHAAILGLVSRIESNVLMKPLRRGVVSRCRILRFLGRAIALVGVLVLVGTTRLSAATRNWKGTTDGSWARADNWLGGVAPKAGDVLVFPIGALPGQTPRGISNTVALAFNTVSLNSGYRLTGNSILALNFGGFAEVGESVVATKVILQPGGTIRTVGELSLRFTDGVLLSGGENRIGGVLDFQGVISGPGGVWIDATGVRLGVTNTYLGPTTIAPGGRLELRPVATTALPTLGAPDGPTRIQAGGSLLLTGYPTLPGKLFTVGENLILDGFGIPPRPGQPPGGAVQVPYLANIRLAGNVTLAGHASVHVGLHLNVPADSTTLQVGDLRPESPGLPVSLTKLGSGLLRLKDPTNVISVPLNVLEGTVRLFEASPGTPMPPALVTPNLVGPITVGGSTDADFIQALADFYVPFPRGIDRSALPPVIGPEVAITVKSKGIVQFGPGQNGLGNPLRLEGGTVRLVDLRGLLSGEAAGWQTGPIELAGSEPSVIQGVFGVRGQQTLRATDPRASLRFEQGTLLGDSLTLDGGTYLLVPTQASQLNHLWLARGSLSSRGIAAAVARTNVVGRETGESGEARLVLNSGQIRAEGSIDVRQTGILELGSATLFDRLSVQGGVAILHQTVVKRAEFNGGAELDLRLDGSGKIPLIVTDALDLSGTVRAKLSMTAAPVANARHVLIRWDGSGPFPGSLEGFPDRSVVPVGPALARVGYTGGNGNDLEIRILPAGPAYPPVPEVVVASDRIVLTWNEAQGCQLETRASLDAGSDWEAVPVEPAVGGLRRYEFEPGPGGIAYFRIVCP